jgi:phage/plasmid primase-like uncharacterized protein
MTGVARELAALMAGRVPALVAELLPAGVREGDEWRCGSLQGERGQSLSVRLHGSKAGVWSDFASGETGDVLDLVAAVRCNGDIRAAMDWARSWLGLSDRPLPAARRSAAPAAQPEPERDADGEARREAALRLFLRAEPELRGTPADAYLKGRGIDLAELGRQPRCLRFVPGLMNQESGRSWPAMVAAINDQAGAHVATHRTWLGQDEAGQWRKAPLRDPKMTLGRYAGGTVRLWRGASGQPMAAAPAGETVALAEGIETALSVVLAAPEMRTLCAVSLANLARVILPPSMTTVLICADNDGDNPAAAKALQRAVAHFTAEGRAVRIARPPVGLKDFNDVLQAGAA